MGEGRDKNSPGIVNEVVAGKYEKPDTWLDHEKEGEVAEATRKKGKVGKHTVDGGAEEARTDVELWRTQRG